ncbi:MAG: tRNA uridine-5-carboxymethylaminomethyl(34) synthesis GTPase MnmE, partial [Clostridiales bacterium]|nr:tRNA uridine-5-carboxymethylaminomethyl(34) synthesis GTPase MnmE [Candidatus Coliplasma caballi]
GEIITGARQFAALSKVKTHLTNALQSLDGFTQDLAGLDMEQALQALYEADGREVSEEIVAEIFSHFCVGK